MSVNGSPPSATSATALRSSKSPISTRNVEPIAARNALGPNGSAQPSESITPAPNASAERSSVPTLPGSDTRHSARATAALASVSRRRKTPRTRGGWPSAETSASSEGSTSSPATSSSTASNPPARAASTRSSPSTTNRPSLSRQRRSCSLRTSLSFSLSRELIRSGAERRLGALGNRPESLRILDGEIGEHLAVERDLGLLQPGDELVVREPVRPRGRVDAHDPESAERALLVLAVAIRVRERVVDLLLRVAVGGLLQPPVALRLAENLAPLLARGDRTLDARH